MGTDSVAIADMNSPTSATSVVGRQYPIQLDINGRASVKVPWTDTIVSQVTNTSLGTIKLGTSSISTQPINNPTSVVGRQYPVQFNIMEFNEFVMLGLFNHHYNFFLQWMYTYKSNGVDTDIYYSISAQDSCTLATYTL